MYSSTFIFASKPLDAEFHRPDQAIAAAAKATPGYLGEESWENAASGPMSNVYDRDSLASLQALMQHPIHLQAKADRSNWLDGHRVEISKRLRRHGDGGVAHPAEPAVAVAIQPQGAP